MRRFLITIISLTVISAAVFGGIVVYKNRLTSKSKIAAEPTTVTESQTPEKSPVSDPNQHDTFDVEFAKKLILYHELAAQLDDHAKVNATQPEIRAFAQAKSVYNTEQSNIYAGMLDSWGAKYTRLAEFPKVAGGGCSGYPTFPGMLPHADVNAYLKTSSSEVDKQYLALMSKHHNGINLIFKAEGDFITYGKLIELRDSFFTTQAKDTEDMNTMQQQYGYI